MLIDSNCNLLNISGCLDVPAPAHDILDTREFDHPPTDIVVALSDRFHDGWDREAIGQDFRRIQVHLVLPDEPSNAGDFRDPFHRTEPILEVPVLKTAQGGEVLLT